MCAGSVSGGRGAAAFVVEEVYPVVGVHLLPEVQVTQAACVFQYFHVNADFIARRLVQGVMERTDQMVMVHEVEIVTSYHNRNRPDA